MYIISVGINNQKTPTVLLLTPEQEFHSFGFTARDFYHDLQSREARRWLYFDRFKMILHHNKVSQAESVRPNTVKPQRFMESFLTWEHIITNEK